MISRKDSKNKFNVDLGYDDIYNHYKQYSPTPLDKKTYNKVFINIFDNFLKCLL